MPPRASNTGGVAHGEWSTMSDADCTTSTRSLPWFRLYTSLTHDIRFRRQPVYIRWAWIAVLSIAARCSKRGYLIIDGENMTPADLADEAAITIEQATESMKWFQSRLLIVSYRGSLRVDGWDRMQFVSDSSTERVRKSRSMGESVKRSKPVSCNVSETPPDNRVQRTDIEHQNTCPKRSKPERLDGFDEWWAQYPKKRGKGAAKPAYDRAMRKVDAPTLLSALDQYKRSREVKDGFIVYPATWLNQERWTDEYDEPATAAKTVKCPECGGAGMIPLPDGSATRCTVCNGGGAIPDGGSE